MAITDRSGAVSSDIAVKLPVRVATTANIALSGTPVVDTIQTEVDDRALVMNQTDPTENGIYDVASGAWTRSADCQDAFAFVQGTIVYVLEGAANGEKLWTLVTEDPEIGSSDLEFEAINLVGDTGADGPQGIQGEDGTDGTDGAGYGGTSTTSVEVTTGAKTVVTQAGYAYQIGARVRLAYTSDPANFLEGVVTDYTGTSLSFTADAIGGTGTYANWTLNIAGAQGATGNDGAEGPAGQDGEDGVDGDTGPSGPPAMAFPYTFDTGTSAADPGTGQVSGNNASLSSATSLYLNETGSDAVSIASVLTDLATCTASRKGFIRLVAQDDPTQWVLFYVTALTDNGTWQTLTVTYVAGSVTSFNADEAIYVQTLRATDTTSSVGKHTVTVPAGAMYPALTNGCAELAQAETTVNKINYKYLAFDPTSTEYAWFQIATPKSYNASTVTMRAVWAHPVTTTNFGVRWAFEILALADDDALDTALGTAVGVTDTGGTTQDFYRSGESGAITPGNTAAKEDWLFVRVSRLPGNAADTMAVDAHLVGVELYYTTDAADDT